MDEISNYGANCDYVRETFELPNNASIYAIVNKITEAYKDLKDKENLSKVAEPTLKKEKKRGRPRKSNSN